MSLLTFAAGDATRPEGDGPKIIAHVCNNAGGWGAGFVLALSARWAAPERAYRYHGSPYDLGSVQLVQAEPELWVANMIAQRGYGLAAGPPIRYGALGLCLALVADAAEARGASVHMPRIGCGLAGGRWDRIEPLVVAALCDRGIPVTVYDLPVE
jgi:O-acetyl-ADP-ribose deacetylase (regulator of RNase III)